jgi:hypothetical protein
MEWNGPELKGPKNNGKEKKRQNLCKPLYVNLQFLPKFTKILAPSGSISWIQQPAPFNRCLWIADQGGDSRLSD